MFHSRSPFFRTVDDLALAAPDAPAFRFVGAGGDSTWSRGDIAGASAALAEELLEQVPGGDRSVAIVSPSVEHQALAFLAAARAGFKPSIFSHPSVKQANAKYIATVPMLLRAAGIEVLMAAGPMADLLESAYPEHGLRIVRIPEVIGRAPWRGPSGSPPPMSFVQYSSGTTGIRKGIHIDEPRLMSNLAAGAARMDFSTRDVTVNWLPLYHDMGLVGALLMPLVVGNESVVMSPFDWLQRPALLLQLLSAHRGTISYLPNFAFALLATRTKPEELEGVRLDTVRVLFSGGEPVRGDAFRAFAARFASLGLRSDVFRVGYGMAECVVSVAITGPSGPREDRIDAATFRRENRAVPATGEGAAMTVVSCGKPVDETFVRIAGNPPERVAGEIEVQSSSLFSGYLGGFAPNPFTSDGWYRTGDHGYLADGEVYVCGRLSDVIIVRGENIYPADVELVVDGVADAKAGRCVAFGVYDESAGTDALIVAVEPRTAEQTAGLAERVLERVHAELGILVSEVFVAEPGALVKSTSGKLSRRKNRELFLAERARSRPAEPEAAALQACVDAIRRVLGIERVSASDHIVLGLGCDSLSVVRLADALSPLVEGGITPAQVLAAGTVGRLAERLRMPSVVPAGPSVRIGDGAGHPIFVFHGLAIPPQAYAGLARVFAGRPVEVLVDPHWGRTYGYFQSLEECAAAYVEEVRRIQPRGPYDFVGDCYGGAVAFEAARLLEARGERTRLAMLETPGPGRRTRLRFQVGGLRRTAIEAALRAATFSKPLTALAAGKLRFRDPAHVLGLIVAIDPDDRRRDAAVRVALPELDGRALRALPADEAWDRVAETLLRAGGKGYRERGFANGAAWRHGMRVDQENGKNLERYRPHAPRRGPTMIVSDTRSAHLYESWSRLCRPLEHVKVPLVAPDGGSTHAALLSADNLRLYGDRLRTWFLG